MSAQPSSPPRRAPRGDLRLSMVAEPGSHSLDGGWWPHSRDLILEMTDLVRQYPHSRGTITHAVFSRPDWDTNPRKVIAGPKVVTVNAFGGEEKHVIVLSARGHQDVTLLVVPPSYTAAQGEEALLAASTPGNAHTGAEVLLEVTDQHDADPADHWTRSEDGTPHRRAEEVPV